MVVLFYKNLSSSQPFFTDRVNHKPIFDEVPVNLTVEIGDTVEFKATVIFESLTPTLTWYRQDCINDIEKCNLTFLKVKEIFKLSLLHEFDLIGDFRT
jgi:hypothetical protein